MNNNLKVNKKALQLIAALLIIIFHLWINVSGSDIENCLKSISYIGVDIFFFVSVYSTAQRFNEVFDYKSFIANRFINIYLKYLLFLIIALLYKNYKSLIYKFLGIEIFFKGGGAFLWFLPAIMIVYLFLPFFLKWKNRYKSLIVLIIYLVIGISITSFTKYKEIFILLNRIPVMLLGYEFATRKIYYHKLTGLCLVIISIVLLAKFGYKNRLNVPIYDFYYLLALPFIIGIVPICENIRLPKLLNKASSLTLEVYALQMIIGFDISNKLYKFIGIPILSNIGTILIVFVLAYLFNEAFAIVLKKLVNH